MLLNNPTNIAYEKEILPFLVNYKHVATAYF